MWFLDLGFPRSWRDYTLEPQNCIDIRYGAHGSQRSVISSRGCTESDKFLCFSSTVYWGYHSQQVLASRWDQFPFCTTQATVTRRAHGCWSCVLAHGDRLRAWARHNLSALCTLRLCFLSVLAPRDLPFFQASSAMCVERSVSHFTRRFYSKTVFHPVEAAACPFQDALVIFYGLSWSLSPVSCLRMLLCMRGISRHKDTAAGHYSLQSLPESSMALPEGFLWVWEWVCSVHSQARRAGETTHPGTTMTHRSCQTNTPVASPFRSDRPRACLTGLPGAPEGLGFSCPQWSPGLASFSSLNHFFTLFWFFQESFLK